MCAKITITIHIVHYNNGYWLMRILIDTNVLILREDPKVLSGELQRLLKVLSENHHTILVHPISITDINHDKDSNRKEIMFSKLGSYPSLASPPIPDANLLI